MYLPMVTEAKNVSNYAVGPYFAAVYTDCKSRGMIEYKHIVVVYRFDKDKDQPQPFFAVAAEIASPLRQMRENSDEGEWYFLGVFDGTGHFNLGRSTEWSDLDKFKRRALEVIRERLNIQHEPQLLTNMN